MVTLPEPMTEYTAGMYLSWNPNLSKLGYTQIQIVNDITEWRKGTRSFGKIFFWKNKPLEGICVEDIKFGDSSGQHMHGFRVAGTENAFRFFTEKGYDPNSKRKNSNEEIVNEGASIKFIDLGSCMDFYDFLKRLSK